MATVTKQFKENFDRWCVMKIGCGEWSQGELNGLRIMIRQDLTPGPDALRSHLTHLDKMGVERPSMIDDHEERYRLWDVFFAEETRRPIIDGSNARIRASIEAERREAA